MKTAIYLALTATVVALAEPPAQPGAMSLYRDHDWFALRGRISEGVITDPLLLGATAAEFADGKEARRYLKPLLNNKQSAADANQWLAYMDLREGRYSAAATHIVATSNELDPLAATLSQLPDQITLSTSPANFPCRYLQRKLFIPNSVNGHSAEFIVDSDANFSFVSESFAKRVGLTVRRSSATTTGALGAASRLSVASADVTIGNTRLHNVAFMVLPDSAILFATLRPEQQGALGLPVLVALRQISWDRDGGFRIGHVMT